VRAEASLKVLAATTDADMAADIRAGIAAVVAAQAVCRADPSYPRRAVPRGVDGG